MDMNDLILVSVDDHVVEPPDLFEGHLPAKYDRTRRRSVDPQGRRHRRVGVRGQRASRTSGSTRSPAVRPRSTASSRPSFDEMRTGCYDIHERVKRHERQRRARLDVLPVASPVLRPAVRRSRRTSDLGARACCRRYNDWHIDEWCGTYPGRFIPLAIPPIWDPS